MIHELYGGPRYQSIIIKFKTGRAKDLSEEENYTIIKETAKKTSCADIAKILGHHTKKIKRFLKDSSSREVRPDKSKLKFVDEQDIRKIKREVFKKPGSTSKAVFENRI